MTDETKDTQEQNTPEASPPPVAGEQQQDDPTVLGELNAQEKGILQQVQRQNQMLTLQIGQAEIRKLGLLDALKNLEQQAEQLLQGVAKRLEIPQGTMWRVGADGKARAISGMGGSALGMPMNQGQPQLKVVPKDEEEKSKEE